MPSYPLTLVDMTHAPYHPVASRLVSAINYAASYEDSGLDASDEHSARNDVIDYWHAEQQDYRARYMRDGGDAANAHESEMESERLERITNILAEHGYTLYVHEDYPGLWLLDRAEADR